MKTTAIKECTCEHEFQDGTYGKGKRVHNLSDSGDEARCTVCGTKTKGSFKNAKAPKAPGKGGTKKK